MEQIGELFSSYGVEKSGLGGLEKVYWNQTLPELVELSVKSGESRLSKDGCVVVETGQHTGRSALDKFVVKRKENENDVWWDNNASMTEEHFENLYDDFKEYAKGRTMFVQDLWGGADKSTRLPVRVFTEYAWHALFIQHLLIEATNDELKDFIPEMTIINFPSFKADKQRHGSRSETMIACDLDRKIVLIASTSYAGENKKSVFTALNYILPTKGVMPMHCSVNVGDKDDAAIFFGLSGTGKTTLSADPDRVLIGDDEHGWSGEVMFNFEGGCYAKMIKLSKEAEPEIYATTKMFGTVLENVIMDERTRELDFDDATLTENTRGAYPISYIENASLKGITVAPKNIIMLTADAFGILPPLARLTPDEAMFHFISGYTAKVAGTEKGITEPTATFSTCFGAPFMPRHPAVYGNLLRELINSHEVDCWLVNTGWTGGKYGVGHRMPIKETRALLNAALSGNLKDVEFRKDEYFGFEVPVSVKGVDDNILNPKNTWDNKSEYDEIAHKLVDMFNDNFEKFEAHVDKAVLAAAPGKH